MDFKKHIDVAANEIRDSIGSKKVQTDDYILAAHSKDGYYPMGKLSTPSIITHPESTEEVQKVVQIANKYKIPVNPQGGTTSPWHSCDSKGGIVLETTKMRKVLNIDERNLCFTVESGVSLHHFDRELRKNGWCYPTHPMNWGNITFGSEVNKDSGGIIYGMGGHVNKRILGLKVVLGNGEILNTGASNVMQNAPHFQQSGIPDLTGLFIASEGAYGIVTEVTLKMQRAPKYFLGADFFFPGGVDGIKKLVNAAQELRQKKIICDAHATDFHGVKLAIRGATKMGVLKDIGGGMFGDVGEIEMSEEALENMPEIHLLAAQVESFFSEEEVKLRKRKMRKIVQKHGGMWFGDGLSKIMDPAEYGADPGIKVLYSGYGGVMPTQWADVPYDSLPELWDIWMKNLKKHNQSTRQTWFEMAFGDDGAQAYFYGSPAGEDRNISTTTEEDWESMRLAHQQTMSDWADVGVIPYRTGRTWRPHVLDKLDSSYRKYINVMKKTFDPNNIMNPGVSVFEEVY